MKITPFFDMLFLRCFPIKINFPNFVPSCTKVNGTKF